MDNIQHHNIDFSNLVTYIAAKVFSELKKTVPFSRQKVNDEKKLFFVLKKRTMFTYLSVSCCSKKSNLFY